MSTEDVETDLRVRRPPASWRAQHAKFRAPALARSRVESSDLAQARSIGNRERVAAGRGVSACGRGKITSFCASAEFVRSETDTRNTLDLAAIALAKELSHLPVIADPSHGTGRRSLIPALSSAALAVGADGLMVEVHPCPERALSDGPQSLGLDGFASLMRTLARPSRTWTPAATMEEYSSSGK